MMKRRHVDKILGSGMVMVMALIDEIVKVFEDDFVRDMCIRQHLKFILSAATCGNINSVMMMAYHIYPGQALTIFFAGAGLTAAQVIFERWQAEKTGAVLDFPDDAEIIKTEAGAVDTLFANVQNFMDGPTVRMIRDLLLLLVSMKYLNGNSAHSIINMFGFPHKMSLMDVIKFIIDVARKIWRFGYLIVSGAPLSAVLNYVDPEVESLTEAKELIQMRENVYTGLPVKDEHRIHVKEYNERCLRVLDVLKAFKSKLKKNDPDYLIYSGTYSKLVEAHRSALAHVIASTRQTPIGVVLAGEPKIGKSNLLRVLYAIALDVLGFPYDTSAVYPRNPDSEYWEGYDPLSHLIIHYSEVALLSPNLVKSKGDDRVVELLSVIDDQSYMVNMAFGGKGCTPMLANFVFIDTNNPTMHLDIIANKPGAFLRRFIFIEPRVKDEFRDINGPGIKSNLDIGSDIMDLWTFDLYTTEVKNDGTAKKTFLMQSSNIDDNLAKLDITLRDLFTRRLQRNQDINNKVVDYITDNVNSRQYRVNEPKVEPPNPIYRVSKLVSQRIAGLLAKPVKPVNAAEVSLRLHDKDWWKEQWKIFTRSGGPNEEWDSDSDDDTESTISHQSLVSDRSGASFSSTRLSCNSFPRRKARHDRYPNASRSLRDEELGYYKQAAASPAVNNPDSQSQAESKVEWSASMLPKETGDDPATEAGSPLRNPYSLDDDDMMPEHVPVRHDQVDEISLKMLQAIYDDCEVLISKMMTHLVYGTIHSGKDIPKFDANYELLRIDSKISHYNVVSHGYMPRCLQWYQRMFEEMRKRFKSSGDVIFSAWFQKVCQQQPWFKKTVKTHPWRYMKKFLFSLLLSNDVTVGEIWTQGLKDHVSTCEEKFSELKDVMQGSSIDIPAIAACFNIFMHIINNVWLSVFGDKWETLVFLFTLANFLYLRYPILAFIIAVFCACRSYGIHYGLKKMSYKMIILRASLDMGKQSFIQYTKAVHQDTKSFCDRNKVNLWALIGGLAAGVIGSVAAGYFVGKKFRRPRIKTEGNAVNIEELSIEKQVLEVETNLGCSPTYTRFPTKTVSGWNQTRNIFKKEIVHTSDMLSIVSKINKQVREIAFSFIDEKGVSGKLISRGYIVKGNYMLFTKHSAGPMSGITYLCMLVAGTEDVKSMNQIKPDDMVQVRGDIWLMPVANEIAQDTSKHIQSQIDKKFSAPIAVGTKISSYGYFKGTLQATDKYQNFIDYDDVIAYVAREDRNSWCGLPAIADYSPGKCVVGLHVAGGGSVGYIQQFTAVDVQKAIGVIESRLSMMPISSETEAQLTLMDPISKSAFSHVPLHNIDYFGKLPGPVLPGNTSKLERSSFYKQGLDSVMKDIGLEPSKRFDIPLMRSGFVDGEWKSPINVYLNELNRFRLNLSVSETMEASKIFSNHIMAKLGKKHPDRTYSPLTMDMAINGVPDDIFIDRINAATGAGYGYDGKKSRHLPLSGISEGHRKPTPELVSDVLALIRSYQQGNIARTVYSACLKDEPRSLTKIRDAKTRVFTGCNLSFLIVNRQILGHFYSSMVENREIFMCGLGTDMHQDGYKIYQRLLNWSPYLFDGDYAYWDIGMPSSISLAAVNCQYTVLKDFFRFNEFALRTFCGIASEIMFPTIEVLKDLLSVPGVVTSGSYGTAELNCIRGVILLISFWLHLERTHVVEGNFFDYILAIVYGDDVIVSVKPKYKDVFNAKTFQSWLQKKCGMDFTDAQKSKDIQPFTRHEELSFLKRTFVTHPRFPVGIAPLDKDSITKALEWTLLSGVVHKSVQELQCAGSMLREAFLHLDEDRYDRLRTFLKRALESEYAMEVGEKELPRFYECYEYYFHSPCPSIQAVEGGRLSVLESSVTSISQEVVTGDISHAKTEALTSALRRIYPGASWDECSYFNGCQDKDMLMNFKFNLIKERADIAKTIEESKVEYEPLTIHSIVDFRVQAQCIVNVEYREYVQLWVRIYEIDSTIASIDRMLSKRDLVFTESAIGQLDTSESKVLDQNENLCDMDTAVKSITDESNTRLVTGQDLPISNWIERPILLATQQFSLNTPTTLFLNPWNLVLTAPSIRAKLRNYAFLHSDLKLKFILAGTPFHKGKVMVAYIPRASENEVYLWHVANRLSTGNTWLKYLSQLEHSKLLDARENVPIEFVVPYVSPTPVARLYNSTSSSLGFATPFNDFDSMGMIVITVFNPISAVNAASATALNLYVYGNLENTVMTCPTATQMVITTEADERKVGPVEKYALYSAQALDAMTFIPSIGPFAKASSMFARGLGQLASIFGWSVPTMITEPQRIRPEPFQNACNVIGYDTGHRLTLDPKQEVSVGGDGVSTTQDEMAISYLCSRFGLLGQGTIPANVVSMTPFYPVAVTPRAVESYTFNTHKLCQPTPLAFAAHPFDYWRGEITYRIEFVSSMFHRGKIAFFFDPNIAQYVLINSGMTLNKDYMMVLDLQQGNAVEFTVKWAFPRDWAMNATDADAITSIGSSMAVGSKYECANGWWNMMMLTTLVSPDGSSIDFNVYCKSDKMAFAAPQQSRLPLIMTEAATADCSEAECCILNDCDFTDRQMLQSTFGEYVPTFRALLRRFSMAQTYNLTTPTLSGNIGFRCKMNNIPIPTVTTTSVATAKYTTLFNYLRYAYIGMRGGIKHRIRLVGATPGTNEHVHVGLAPSQTAQVANSVVQYTYFDNDSEIFGSSRIDGVTQFAQTTNAGVEFEVPYYTNNLYLASNNAAGVVFSSGFNQRYVGMYHADFDVITGSTVRQDLVDEFAIAEDFSFLRFVAAPFYTIN